LCSTPVLASRYSPEPEANSVETLPSAANQPAAVDPLPPVADEPANQEPNVEAVPEPAEAVAEVQPHEDQSAHEPEQAVEDALPSPPDNYEPDSGKYTWLVDVTVPIIYFSLFSPVLPNS
jgi:hypothetical protein